MDWSRALAANIALTVPDVHQLVPLLQSALAKNFEHVQVDVEVCPDLRAPPYSLAADGLGQLVHIAAVGGWANFVGNGREKLYDLRSIAETCQLPKGFVFGPAIGDTGSEIIANCSFDNSNGGAENNDGRFAVMANLLVSDGSTAPVIRIHARRRIGPATFTESIRHAITDKYINEPMCLVGVFAVRCGRIQVAISCGTPVASTIDDNSINHHFTNTVRYVQLDATPVIGATVIHSLDPGLSLTIEQTHCWNEQGVGRYINDDDDSNSGGGVDSIVEYDAFLVPAQFLYRIDQVSNAVEAISRVPSVSATFDIREKCVCNQEASITIKTTPTSGHATSAKTKLSIDTVDKDAATVALVSKPKRTVVAKTKPQPTPTPTTVTKELLPPKPIKKKPTTITTSTSPVSLESSVKSSTTPPKVTPPKVSDTTVVVNGHNNDDPVPGKKKPTTPAQCNGLPSPPLTIPSEKLTRRTSPAGVLVQQVVVRGSQNIPQLRVPAAAPTHISDLPVTVFAHILTMLNFETIGNCRRVCRRWDEMCGDALNNGYRQLVKKADELLRVVKRRLPIGDAARSDHAMHSISTTLTSFQCFVLNPVDILSAAIDEGVCCFPYGRVLDRGFRLLIAIEYSITVGSIGGDFDWKSIAELSRRANEHYKRELAVAIDNRLGDVFRLKAAYRLQKIDSFMMDNAVSKLERAASMARVDINWELDQLRGQNQLLKKENRELRRDHLKLEGRVEMLEQKFKTVGRLLQ